MTDFKKQFLADLLTDIEDIQAYLIKNHDEIAKDKDFYRPYFLKEPDWAFWFARVIDKRSRKDTREIACQVPRFAYFYATWLEGPHDDTREAVLCEPYTTFCYARDVDKCYRLDTFNVVKGTQFETMYLKQVSKVSDVYLEKRKNVKKGFYGFSRGE